MFITIEGPDGAGKSTQVNNIAKYFEDRGYSVVRTREPGGTVISEKLREIVLDPENTEMSDVAETMIYAAARAQHVAEKIAPALSRGEVVICDRFIDSSIAYQGYGRELGEKVREVNLIAVNGTMPDVTFFLDLDPAIGIERISANREGADRLEQEAMDFHYKIYEGFKEIAQREPERFIVIDASRSVDEIKADIYAKLDEITKR